MNKSEILQHLHTERGQEYREAFGTLIPKINATKNDIAILVAHNFPKQEIANAYGISSDAVDDHRSWLRTALSLERDESLESALLKLIDIYRKGRQ